MAQVTSIVYKPSSAESAEGSYTRIPVQEIELVADKGILGDLKATGGSRQLNVMTAETLTALAAEGFATSPGRMGEQLMVTGLDVDLLSPGDRLKIGESAIIEKAEARTGCAKFERVQGKLRTEAAGRLGMMARVIVGGPIKVGDEVTIV